MSVGKKTAEETIQLRDLVASYRAAFRRWSSHVSRSQSRGTPAASDGSAHAAQVAYRESRDSLADFLLTSRRSRVRRLAYQLWERAGRPGGSAEADWNHAERLIRRRSAR